MAKKLSRFAHLMGLRARSSEEEEERDETQEEEKDDAKGKKAKSRKAEDEKDDPNADDEQDDPDSEDDSEDPDASEEDDDGAEDGDDEKEAKAVKQGRRAERERCARIFGSQHAAGNPSLAAALAFETGMSSAQAIKVLSSSGRPVGVSLAPARMTLDQRMSGVKNVQLGMDKKPAAASSAKGRAEIMTGLYNRAKGVK